MAKLSWSLAAIRWGATCIYGLRRSPVSPSQMIESRMAVCASRVVGQVGLVHLDAVCVAPQRAPRVRANPTPVLFLAWLPLSLADSLRRRALSSVSSIAELRETALHTQAYSGP